MVPPRDIDKAVDRKAKFDADPSVILLCRRHKHGPKSRFTSKALDYAFNRYIGTDHVRIESFEEELVNAELARKIYDLRTRAGFTQKELAALVGTTASVISRLEDADYENIRWRCSVASPPAKQAS